MSTELENRLRAAFTAGAIVIPVDDRPLAIGDEAPTDRRPWTRTVVLAAAAVVIAVAALAVALSSRTTSAPPAHRPSITHSAPPSSITHSAPPSSVSHIAPPPLSVIDGLHPVQCISDQAAWVRALSDGKVAPPNLPTVSGANGLPLLGVDSRGNAVVVETAQPNRVLLVRPDHSTETLFTSPRSVAGQGPAHVGWSLGTGVDGDWAVFTINTNATYDVPTGIYVVNTDTRQVKVVRDVALGNKLIVSLPIIVRGTVYWREGTHSGYGHIYAYDIATGTRQTLESGDLYAPFTIAGGVYWFRGSARAVVTHIAGQLPPGYVVGHRFNPPVLTTSGLVAWTAQDTREVVVREGAGPSVPVDRAHDLESSSVLALSANFVVWNTSYGIYILDLRTGAAFRLKSDPTLVGAASAGGTLALNSQGAGNGFDLTILDVATLPELHC